VSESAVRAVAFPALVAQAADDGHVLAQRFQRIEDERKVEVAPRLLRLPLVLKRAQREIDETQTRTGSCDRLRQRRSRGDHRIEQRERDGGACALENRT